MRKRLSLLVVVLAMRERRFGRSDMDWVPEHY